MKKNITLTDEDVKNIILAYKEKTPIHIIATNFQVGKLRIKEILHNNNITSNKTNISKIANSNYKNKLQGEYYEITCKTTGKKFYGTGTSTCRLTSHLILIQPKIIIPNNFERKKFFLSNNYTWHEQYFTYIEIVKPKTIKCKYCTWETEDITNISGAYTNHLKITHNKTIEDHLNDFPDEIKYFNTYNIKLENKKFLSEPKNSVICLECGKVLKSITYRHVKLHNMSMLDYKNKYGLLNIFSQTVKDKQLLHWNNVLKNNPYTFISKSEQDIKKYIETFIKRDLITSDRKILKGQEIDIVLDEEMIGIEYHGNLWHSEKFGKKNSSFHLNKTKIANENKYNLIQIFEDEWHLKQDLVKNKLKHILGYSNGIKIGGRKCEIKNINKITAKYFLDKFHIQGGISGNINLGAYFNNNLIAVMSFNKKRNMTTSKKQYEYDLIRFATDYNYIIQGIGSKLFSYFINNYNPSSIISFADRRWSFETNNIYQITGFKKDGYVKPNYWYYNPSFDRYKRYHKFGFGLNSLKKKGMYINGMSEWECMQYHGWDRIWDCGLIRYIWEK